MRSDVTWTCRQWMHPECLVRQWCRCYLSGIYIPIRSISSWKFSLLLHRVHLKKKRPALWAWRWHTNTDRWAVPHYTTGHTYDAKGQFIQIPTLNNLPWKLTGTGHTAGLQVSNNLLTLIIKMAATSTYCAKMISDMSAAILPLVT